MPRGGPKIRSLAKGASRGLKWQKGHSCVSNPTTTKHRDQASSGFLHPVKENPLFTVKNVAAIQNRDDGVMETDLTSEVDSLSLSDISCGSLNSVSTLKSLSSAWSKCSTNAFDRFLKRFRSDSLVHKEMLSILAASSDVINGAGGKLNETEFFATFLSLLESCQPDQYQPVMSLVCIITPRVSPAVLKLRFADIYPKIATILTKAAQDNNDLLLRTSIEALQKVLRIQENLNLESDTDLQSVLYHVLKCTLHERPRVRKKARLFVKRLVSSPSTSIATPLTKLTLGWILDQLAEFPTCDPKVCADVLSLLLLIWPSVTSITKPGAKRLFEGVLRVMSSGDSSIMKIGFTFFIQAFTNFSPLSECDPEDELFSKLIIALWELQPDTRNTDTFILWARSILSGLVRLLQGTATFDMTYLSSSLDCSSPLWFTNHGPAIAQLCREFFPHLVTESLSSSIVDHLFRVISKNLLSLPPSLVGLQILEGLLDSLGPSQYQTAAQDVFLQLIPLRHAQGVLSAMGRFIRAFGVDSLWNTVDPATRWLVILPLIPDNLHNSEIRFWKTEVLPGIGSKCKPEVGWAALAGFCRNPQDPDNFPAELVGKVIVEKPQVRLQALAALRQYVEWPQCLQTCRKYSKNYLPLLFNLYIKTKPEGQTLPGHCDAVGTTIQKYLEHCDPVFVQELTHRALSKLTSDEVEEAGSPVFDLVAFLALHVNDKELQDKILDGTVKKWVKTQDSKRAYRIMTNLSKNKTLDKDVLIKLVETLRQTKAETKSNAAALRIECLLQVTMLNNDWLKDFITEAIINLLSVNAKAKKLSGEYVKKFAEHLKESGQGVASVMEIIRVGLSSPIPLMVASTLRFAWLLYSQLTPETVNLELVEGAVAHLQSSTDALVWKQALEWLCLNLKMYKGALGPVAAQIGQVVSDPRYPKKDSTKLLARLIKVFGAVGVKAIVPDSEDGKMRTRIKNICKKLREKKKSNEKKENQEEDDMEGEDSEEEDESVGLERRMTGEKPLVMKEGVVDFLSPGDVARSLVNERPAKKEAFKMSKDGKLIIDTGDEGKKGRKRGAPEDDSEEEDSDGEDDDEEMDSEDEEMVAKLKKNGGKSNMSAKSIRTQGSKFSLRSMKSGRSSRSSVKSGGKKKGGMTVKTKGIHRELPRRPEGNKNKKFKSSKSSSGGSVKSGKSRKSAAASTFRLKF